MSSTTPNLGLFKYDTSTDGKEVFSIQTALNDNWDIIDNMDLLPDQTGKSGYLLTTNGTTASWGETGEIYPVIETYIEGTSWYRVYSDGWCEQGGYSSGAIGTDSSRTISLLKNYKDTNYNVFQQSYGSASNAEGTDVMVYSKATDTFIVKNEGYVASMYGLDWKTEGYIEV